LARSRCTACWKPRTFKFSGPSTATAGSINGGGDGNNWLDYSALSSASPAAVSLASGSASRVGGTISNARHVAGGQGNDSLRGDGFGNVLIGNAGNDVIDGGAGRGIVIGGPGSDNVFCGPGDDTVVGGVTAFDGTPADRAKLAKILGEWQPL
jgi:Ca2+-binding RTX toxin-like protein